MLQIKNRCESCCDIRMAQRIIIIIFSFSTQFDNYIVIYIIFKKIQPAAGGGLQIVGIYIDELLLLCFVNSFFQK